MKHLYYIAALAATFLTAMLFTRKKKQRTMLRSNNNASPFASSQPWGKKR